MDNLWDHVDVDRCSSAETRQVLRQIVKAGVQDGAQRERLRVVVDNQLKDLKTEASATHNAVNNVRGQTAGLGDKMDRVLRSLEGDPLTVGIVPRLRTLELSMIEQDRALRRAEGEQTGRASAWSSFKAWWPVILAVLTALGNLVYNVWPGD